MYALIKKSIRAGLFWLALLNSVGSAAQTFLFHGIPVQNGDIIFRNGIGKESSLIRKYSLRDTNFSHVGLCLVYHGKPYVYHMLGGGDNISGKMLRERLDVFCDSTANDRIGVFKINTSKINLQRLAYFTDSIFNSSVTFDYNFSLTNNSLYCTEFIVLAIRHASKNMLVVPPVRRPFHGERGISDRSVLEYYPIDYVQNLPFLKKKKVIIFRK